MKKLLAAISVIAIASLSLFAGGSKESSASYTVGICQLVQHPALDAATNGFMDAINKEMGEGSVKFLNQNASGEITNCSTIINGFVSSDVDLIMANATAPLTTAAAATSSIPILGTSVTDYATALEIENFSGTVGTNVSGTSDLAPLSEQASMIKELFPDAKKVGLLYCSAEANSVYQIEQIEKYLASSGIASARYSFTDTNDVSSVATKAASECDVIYIPTDNTAAANTEAIANVVLPLKTPVVAGEEGICSGCGVATLSIDYYDLGYATGEMAVKILRDGSDVSKMPIEYAPIVTKKYNKANADALNISIPEGYVAI